MRDLWSKSLIPITRLTALERDGARLEGERGQLIATIAQARGKISEIELQIIQIDQDAAQRGREGACRHPRQDRRTGRAQDRRRGPAAAHRHPRAAVGRRASAHGPHAWRRGRRRRAAHADRAGGGRPDRRGARHAAQHRSVHGRPDGDPTLPGFNQRTTPELNGRVSRIAADVIEDSAPVSLTISSVSPSRRAKSRGSRPKARSRHAGRGVHPHRRAHHAVLSAQAADRPGQAGVSGAVRGQGRAPGGATISIRLSVIFNTPLRLFGHSAPIRHTVWSSDFVSRVA